MNIDKSFVFWDIVAAEIPFTDGNSTKIRPILVLKRDREDYLVLRISSIIHSKDSYDIELLPDFENNLKSISLLKIGKIGLFHKYILRKKIGNISTLQKVQLKKNMKCFIEEL